MNNDTHKPSFSKEAEMLSSETDEARGRTGCDRFWYALWFVFIVIFVICFLPFVILVCIVLFPFYRRFQELQYTTNRQARLVREMSHQLEGVEARLKAVEAGQKP
jgi:hypothetical protein